MVISYYCWKNAKFDGKIHGEMMVNSKIKSYVILTPKQNRMKNHGKNLEITIIFSLSSLSPLSPLSLLSLLSLSPLSLSSLSLSSFSLSIPQWRVRGLNRGPLDLDADMLALCHRDFDNTLG